jgi:predicted nucleic acid-binding protein
LILVDTSAWVSWLRGESTAAVASLEHILSEALPFGITGVIYQEILQGADSDASFHKMSEYFASQRFYAPDDARTTRAAAADLFRRCRAHGITVLLCAAPSTA